MRVTSGEILHPPAIQYQNETVNLPIQDRDGREDVAWPLGRKRFIRSFDKLVWVAMLVQKGIPGNQVEYVFIGSTLI